jgi:predicted AlkP superfamily pyrophosphatase or phosphodiesterase
LRSSIFLILLFFCALWADAQKKNTPYVVLVSFDGFRYDYVKHFEAPNFKEFIKKGSQAEALIPSFPSKTFPNHYSIVTGLHPGNHGLVDNSFYDKTRNTTYGMRDLAKVVDGYYYGGIPLWQLAMQHGVKSASYFWVGSEMSEDARRPDYYYTFNDTIHPLRKVNQVIDWLKLPQADRPHLITLYFSSPDHEGHDFGPWAEQTKNAVLRADSLLGALMTGIESTKLPVNVILVSDHGMFEIDLTAEKSIFIDELINRKDKSVRFVNGGTQMHLYMNDISKRDSVYTVLKSREGNFKVMKKEEFPARWNYQHERAGDLLVEAKPGFYIRGASREQFLKNEPIGEKRGVHGYDPEATTEVLGIFYAQGPNIKSRITLPPFQNIHVYPLVARILGLPLPPIDGNPEVLHKLYKRK